MTITPRLDLPLLARLELWPLYHPTSAAMTALVDAGLVKVVKVRGDGAYVELTEAGEDLLCANDPKRRKFVPSPGLAAQMKYSRDYDVRQAEAEAYRQRLAAEKAGGK